MASKTITQVPTVDINLKRVFDSAVRDLYHSGINSKSAAYRTPIVQRAGVPVESADSAEKKALSDAAKALAQLWKVSPGR